MSPLSILSQATDVKILDVGSRLAQVFLVKNDYHCNSLRYSTGRYWRRPSLPRGGGRHHGGMRWIQLLDSSMASGKRKEVKALLDKLHRIYTAAQEDLTGGQKKLIDLLEAHTKVKDELAQERIRGGSRGSEPRGWPAAA